MNFVLKKKSRTLSQTNSVLAVYLFERNVCNLAAKWNAEKNAVFSFFSVVSTHISNVIQWRRCNEHDIRCEFGCAQNFQCLRFNIQYGHFSLVVNAAYCIQFRAIHRIFVSACNWNKTQGRLLILIRIDFFYFPFNSIFVSRMKKAVRKKLTVFQIFIGGNVSHHFVMGYKIIATSIFFILTWCSSCICTHIHTHTCK